MKESGELISEQFWPANIFDILDRITDGLFALDSEWRFTYVNDMAGQLLFRDRQDLLGKNVWTEFPDAIDTRFYNQYTQALQEQVAVAFEEFYPPLASWFEVRAFPSASGLTVYFSDVTHRHQANARHEQHYQSLFKNNPYAVYSLTLEGKMLDMNSAAERLTGYMAAELRGKTYDLLILEHDLEIARDRFQQAASGISQTYTLSSRRKDGRVLRIEVTHLPIQVDGTIVGVYGIAKDITELHQTMERLRVSETRLAHAQKIAQLGYWEWDIVTNTVAQSEGLRRIYGFDHPAIQSLEAFMERVHPDDKESVAGNIRAAFAGEAIDMEFRIIRPDGSIRVIYSQAGIEFVEGKPKRLMGVNLDVTERRNSEQARREAENKFLALVQAAQDAIVITDEAGEIKLWNRGATNVFGFGAAEMLGRRINQLAPEGFQSHQIRGVGRLLRRYHQTPGKTVEVPALTKDGRTISVELSLTELMHQGQVHFIAIIRDVTERKKMDAYLRKSDKLSAVGQLAAGVAHEIRNPLTALKGFLQLIAAENATNDRYVEIMSDELLRIEFIVGELLVLAKPQATRFSLGDLRERLTDVATLLKAQAVMNNVDIVLELEPDLPPIRCEGNQLKQVFINLIKNAIEAMPGGGTVLVSAKKSEGAVVVRVIDEGQGIPAELLGRIGDPFYSTKENGTGLGLMVSHKIVELHQGTLHIESEVDRGTTITITLPIQPLEPLDKPTEAQI